MLNGWLTYGDEKFRWEYDNNIEIRPYNRKMNKILVEFEHQCLLKLINKRLKDKKNIEISHIPPEFISKAIKKAIENNWNSKDGIGQINLDFNENGFEVKK
ncbi:hypothetical protein [Aquimarina rubra]|uniref:Uncharacterized protein n=1 Tax=Aquimarina rubra TaxID=1920033 RepID=A0ABW5LJJ6_9FLAO